MAHQSMHSSWRNRLSQLARRTSQVQENTPMQSNVLLTRGDPIGNRMIKCYRTNQLLSELPLPIQILTLGIHAHSDHQ